jgi:3-isopropylmalate/(R)-2-methylmalate dehydratase small subunit
MNPVSTIFAKTYHFGLKNVDTDVIILAAWLKTISRTGLVGTGFFSCYAK